MAPFGIPGVYNLCKELNSTMEPIRPMNNRYTLPMKLGSRHDIDGRYRLELVGDCSTDRVVSWSSVSKTFEVLDKIQQEEAHRDAPDLLEDLSWKTEGVCEKKAERFVRWLNKNGSDTSKITIRPNAERTAFSAWTNRPILEHEIVFSVPRAIHMTSDYAENILNILPMESESSEVVPPEHMENMKPVLFRSDLMRLAILLVYEKWVLGKKSFWQPYLDVLPRLESSLFLGSYTLEDVELLNESWNGLREVWSQLKLVFGEYTFIYRIALQRKKQTKTTRALAKVFTFRRYLWARTRAWDGSFSEYLYDEDGVETSGNGYSARLDPLQDMLYPQASEWATVYSNSDTEDFLIVAAMVNLGSNMPLSKFMENGDSKSYFKFFGWIPDNFPVEDDSYDLFLGISESDKLFDRKMGILKKLDWYFKQEVRIRAQLFLCDIESEDSRETFDRLFTFIRIIQADELLLDRIDSIGTDFLAEPTPESWTFLSNRLTIWKKASERAIHNVSLKLGIGGNKVEARDLTKKQETILQFLTTEKAILTCLVDAVATAKKIDTEGGQFFETVA